MTFGFSYVGLIFLVLLFVPNLLWTKNKPRDYERYAKNEKKLLLTLERAGEAAVCCAALFFGPGVGPPSRWSLWLLASALAMAGSEADWIRFFKSEKVMRDFYSSLLGIPVAGATLPVAAFLLLGVYGKNPLLIVSVIVLGIGHIGIHWNHKKEIS
jgi:hypothetical protein